MTVSIRPTIKCPKRIKFEKKLGEVLLPVNIEVAHEELRTQYTSILRRPLFSEGQAYLPFAIVGS